MSAGRPPRLARWILNRALPRDAREHVAGDLEEGFADAVATRGPAAARRWYWRRAASFSARFLAERARSLNPLRVVGGFSWMDFRLGLRMLVRYPGLTLVGVCGIAVGVAIAAGAYGIFTTFTHPAVPLDEGARVAAIQNFNAELGRPERRIWHDLRDWRTQVKSLVDVGGFRHTGRNLVRPGMHPEVLRLAEMSAAGFRVGRTAPILGRYLVEQDERPEAAPVVVLGEDLWRSRFDADPTIVGRAIHLGAVAHTVVGVMPASFRFPVDDRAWIPLRLDPSRYQRGAGPTLQAFGRLAPGATFEAAQAELSALAQRTASEHPKTHAHLRASVLPYTYPFFDIDDPSVLWLVRLVKYLLALLLVIVCINVAILVYARTATRHAEIAVRAALGASRRRIVSQLFVEALVLSAIAAFAGVLLTSYGLAQVNTALRVAFGDMLPFWWTFRVSPGMVLYVAVLTVIAATIIGAVPALKATGKRVQTGLQAISAGGGSGMQLGRTWTTLIVVQVAFAVALLPAAVYQSWSSMRLGTRDASFPAHEYLVAQVAIDRLPASGVPDLTDSAYAARYHDRYTELVRRLRQEPAVAAVTSTLHSPAQEPSVFVEVEGIAVPDRPGDYSLGDGSRMGYVSAFTRVDDQFFGAFRMPLLTGRGFATGDSDPSAQTLVANRTFVERILGGSDAVGRRVRFVGRGGDTHADQMELNRWYEIVGVVQDFPVGNEDETRRRPTLYGAIAAGRSYPLTMALQLRATTPEAFTGRVRDVGAGLDPNLQLRDVTNLDTMLRRDHQLLQLVALGLAIVTACVVALSAAGIYALMSFTVSRRRKEIGIRAALGADPSQILKSIFARAATQLTIGAVLGMAIALLLDTALEGEMLNGSAAVVLPLVACVMMLVGLGAAFVPARRGLAIQPTEALREQ